MYIVGITGPIGHGKSSLAEFLGVAAGSARHFEISDLIAEVANGWKPSLPTEPISNRIEHANAWLRGLPPVLKASLQLDVSYEQLHITADKVATHPVDYEKLWTYLDKLQAEPELVAELIDATTKDRHRVILQWLGGYLQRFEPSVWFVELVRRIKAEAAANQINLYTISALRYPTDAAAIREAGGTVIEVDRPDYDVLEVTDPTERERHQIKSDTVVVNNGSLDELKRAATVVWQDLSSGQLKDRYAAKA